MTEKMSKKEQRKSQKKTTNNVNVDELEEKKTKYREKKDIEKKKVNEYRCNQLLMLYKVSQKKVVLRCCKT